MSAQDMVEQITRMEPQEAAEFWRQCMSYAQQFPEMEFWSVVTAVYLAPLSLKRAL